MNRSIVALALVALAATAGTASAAGKGSSLFSIGLGQGTAETYSSFPGTGAAFYLAPDQSPEINAGVEYWYLFSDDYAFAASGAAGFSSMKWESSGADPEVKATGSSFKVRVGGDRVGKVGDRLTVFMGPGLQFWSGKSKIEGLSPTTIETESITRFGVSGRIGGIMMLSDALGIQGQVGHTFGMATAEDKAKSTWYPSSFEASWGLTFAFGGN